MNYLVYKHTSPSGKAYIGITNDYDRRSEQHQYYDWCPAFHAAIKKYGWNNFIHEILFTDLTDVEAGVLETKLITEHNTLYPHGYNLVEGGGNRAHTEETKRRMSEAKKGRPGRKVTEEEKLKRAATRKANPSTCSETTKAAVAKATAKTYIVTSPDGKEETVTNLQQFCRDNGLHYVTMVQVAGGKWPAHKKWKCRRVTS